MKGSASNKFVIAAGASAGDIATDSITSVNLAKYDYIEFWIKSTVATSAGNLKILLDDSASCASPIETLNVPALTANTWKYCRVALSNPHTDTAIISVGLEYIPDYREINTYSKIIRYRFGYQYNSTYLDFNNHNIIEQKLCFGVGLPFLKTGSFLNLSMEMGKRGTLDYNLIEEKFVNILVGFKFNDVWFLKRKYD